MRGLGPRLMGSGKREFTAGKDVQAGRPGGRADDLAVGGDKAVGRDIRSLATDGVAPLDALSGTRLTHSVGPELECMSTYGSHYKRAHAANNRPLAGPTPHAYLFVIKHPETAENLAFRSELPGDLRRLRAAFAADSRKS